MAFSYKDLYNYSYNKIPSKSEEKKANLESISEQKKSSLDPNWIKQNFTGADLIDADTLRLMLNPKGGRVTYPNGEGYSLDTYETKKPFFDNLSNEEKLNIERRLEDQKVAAGLALGKNPSDVTYEDIYTLGDKAIAEAEKVLYEGQQNIPEDPTFEGPIQSKQQIEYTSFGKDKYGRDLIDVRNPITGKSLREALNKPSTNAAYTRSYNAKKFAEDLNRNNEIGNRDRTAEEIAQDTALSLGLKGSMQIGQSAYGLADTIYQGARNITDSAARQIDKVLPDWLKSGVKAELPSNLSDAINKSAKQVEKIIPDELLSGVKARNLSQTFADTTNIVNTEMMSKPSQYSRQQYNKQLKEFQDGTEKRLASLRNEGYTELGADLVNIGLEFKEGLSAYANNPLTAIDDAMSSTLNLVVAGALGKHQVSKELNAKLSTMSADKAAKFIASKEGKKLIDKAATKAGLSTTVLLESLSNRVQTQGEIMSMSDKDLLKTSEQYRELRNNNYSEEQAKLIIADKAATMNQAATMITSLVAAKIANTPALEGKLFLKNLDNKSIIQQLFGSAVKTASGTAKEALEETLQGASQEITGNIAKKTYVDPNQKITENVGSAAASGLVAGGLSGGGMVGISETGKTVANVLDKTITNTKEVTNKIKDKLKPKEEPVTSPIDNAKSELQNAQAVSENLDLTKEQKYESLDKLYNDAVLKLADLDETKDADTIKTLKDDITRIAGLRQPFKAEQDKIKQSKGKEVLSNANKVQGTEEFTDEDLRNISQLVMGSEELSTENNQALDNIEANEAVNERVRNAIKIVRSLRDQIKNLPEGDTKNKDNVHSEILSDGLTSTNKEGIQEHIKNIFESATNKDAKGIKQSIGKLTSWLSYQQTKINNIKEAANSFDPAKETERLVPYPSGEGGIKINNTDYPPLRARRFAEGTLKKEEAAIRGITDLAYDLANTYMPELKLDKPNLITLFKDKPITPKVGTTKTTDTQKPSKKETQTKTTTKKPTVSRELTDYQKSSLISFNRAGRKILKELEDGTSKGLRDNILNNLIKIKNDIKAGKLSDKEIADEYKSIKPTVDAALNKGLLKRKEGVNKKTKANISAKEEENTFVEEDIIETPTETTTQTEQPKAATADVKEGDLVTYQGKERTVGKIEKDKVFLYSLTKGNENKINQIGVSLNKVTIIPEEQIKVTELPSELLNAKVLTDNGKQITVEKAVSDLKLRLDTIQALKNKFKDCL